MDDTRQQQLLEKMRQDKARIQGSSLPPCPRLLSHATSLPLPFASLPDALRRPLDELATYVLNPLAKQTVVMGCAFAGKSFLIEQLAYNIEHYTSKSGQKPLEFVRLSELDALELASPLKARNLVASLLRAYGLESEEELCLVTEAYEVAALVSITLPHVRIMLEADTRSFQEVVEAATPTATKSWLAWQTFDASSMVYTREELLEALQATIVKLMNSNLKQALRKRDVARFVDFLLEEMPELMIKIDDDDPGLIAAPLGLWSTSYAIFASNLFYLSSKELRHSNGRMNWEKLLTLSFEKYSNLFENFLEQEKGGTTIEVISVSPDEIDKLSSVFPEEVMAALRDKVEKTSGGEPAKAEESKSLSFSDLSTLRARLNLSIMGQEEAIDRVVKGMAIASLGLNDPRKPIRSFLFLGPTGVGKTQLALTLAEELMEEAMNVVRVDLSEYQHDHEVAKLFGSPPGYVGHEEGGVLTNAVLKHPNSVVILDEIEKAHPRVWEAFLPLLDAGTMTDSKGVEVDFSKTVVIMTSNIGVEETTRKRSGFLTTASSYEERQKDNSSIVLKALENTMKPELINRIDEVVVFKELSEATALAIVAKEFSIYHERMEEKGYHLDALEKAVGEALLAKADISKYGAREIQRVVTKEVFHKIAELLIDDPAHKSFSLALTNGAIAITPKRKK